MKRNPKAKKPRVWKDEDDDWIWVCRRCWCVGAVERDQPAAFATAFEHATSHHIIGFKSAA